VNRYTPKPSLAKGVGRNVSCPNAVALVNGQDSHEEHALEFHGVVVDYHEFTRSVVDALKAELESNGVVVCDEADKKLRVTVTRVTMMPGPMTYRGTVEATVEMGDGRAEKFQATRASYASGWNVIMSPTKPLAVAFRDLIGAILGNDVVQQYLSN